MCVAPSPDSSQRALSPQPQGLVGRLPAAPGPSHLLSPRGQSFRTQSSLPRTPCSGKVLRGTLCTSLQYSPQDRLRSLSCGILTYAYFPG